MDADTRLVNSETPIRKPRSGILSRFGNTSGQKGGPLSAPPMETVADANLDSRPLAVTLLADLIGALSDNPENLYLWERLQSNLPRWAQEPNTRSLFPNIATIETLTFETCLEKAKCYLAIENKQIALKILRTAERNLTKRRDKVRLTHEASRLDEEFVNLVTSADVQRDSKNWAQAEWRYWEALQKYPYHNGYAIQYAHTLKEQGKFIDAEMYYRNALALDANEQDVMEHLAFVTRKNGHNGNVVPLKANSKKGENAFDDAPTRKDIESVYLILLGRHPHNFAEIVREMREAATCGDVIRSVVGTKDFINKQKKALIVFAQQQEI